MCNIDLNLSIHPKVLNPTIPPVLEVCKPHHSKLIDAFALQVFYETLYLNQYNVVLGLN